MSHALRTLVFGLTLLASLCAAGIALAGPTIPSQGTASGRITLHIDPKPDNLVGRQEWVATGVANLIGRHTSQGVTSFTADGKFTGTYLITTADGATLTGNYAGTFAPIRGTANFQFNAVMECKQGTGRLQGLTCRGSLVAIVNGQTGALQYNWSGVWILP